MSVNLRGDCYSFANCFVVSVAVRRKRESLREQGLVPRKMEWSPREDRQVQWHSKDRLEWSSLLCWSGHQHSDLLFEEETSPFLGADQNKELAKVGVIQSQGLKARGFAPVKPR